MTQKLSLLHWTLFSLFMASISCAAKADLAEENLGLLQLPPGFTITVFATGVENARQLALGDRGTVFAGSRKAGKVHAVVDRNGDHFAELIYLVDEGLEMPSGLEFRYGSLYVAALDRILRYDDIESFLDQPPRPDLVTDNLPDKTHHGWKYLRFGPDQQLYVPVGAPCNVCEEPGFAQIRRMLADGSGQSVYAEGVRNSVGLAFHPETDELWFTDNGRDLMGDDIPSDELNHAPEAGLHFGFPHCHQGDISDPEFADNRSCDEFEPPAARLGPHVAALGLRFYTGDMFPASYRNQLFVARHGSWNRTEKIGYDIALVRFNDAGDVTSVESFANGWLQGQDDWGRPNDVLQLPDGSLLVSDDKANVIYSISYQAN